VLELVAELAYRREEQLALIRTPMTAWRDVIDEQVDLRDDIARLRLRVDAVTSAGRAAELADEAFSGHRALREQTHQARRRAHELQEHARELSARAAELTGGSRRLVADAHPPISHRRHRRKRPGSSPPRRRARARANE
jgi:hypothetical protein